MADELDREPVEGEQEELENGEEQDSELENEELETEGDGDETDLPEGESSDGKSGTERQERTARGLPDTRQRDLRQRRQQEDFDRLVDQAVERRLGTVRAPVDFEAQRRERDNRRNQELENARLQGPEAYADVRDRHLREDYRADEQHRQAQAHDDRDTMQFDRLRDRNPAYDSVANEVEKQYRELRGQGLLPRREVIAKVILGERYAERIQRQGGQQRRRAADTVRRQTVRPPANSAGHQPAPRSRRSGNFNDLSVEDMERQLSGLPVRSSSIT